MMPPTDAEIRMAFAGYVAGTIMTASSRAVHQALDPKLPALTPEAIINYCKTMREFLDSIESGMLTTEPEPEDER